MRKLLSILDLESSIKVILGVDFRVQLLDLVKSFHDSLLVESVPDLVVILLGAFLEVLGELFESLRSSFALLDLNLDFSLGFLAEGGIVLAARILGESLLAKLDMDFGFWGGSVSLVESSPEVIDLCEVEGTLSEFGEIIFEFVLLLTVLGLFHGHDLFEIVCSEGLSLRQSFLQVDDLSDIVVLLDNSELEHGRG